jgi:protein-disulfide isomerase
MRLRYGWLIAWVVAVILVAACGSPITGPTAATEATQAPEAPQAETVAESGDQELAATPEEEPMEAEPAAAELPVDSDDWHALGSPDAPVTIVEYSDFQ